MTSHSPDFPPSESRRAVLVTGASSGLGAGLARVYAEPGTWIGLLGRDERRLAATAAAVHATGGRSWQRALDVTDTAAMTRAVQDFAQFAGRLDVVIANAGVGEGSGEARFSPEAVADVLRINTIGLTNTLLPALPLLRARGSGSLVGMASLAGYGALPGSLTYSASKAFVRTFMRGLRMELAGSGVQAIALCPGFVRTPLTDKNTFPMPLLIECDDACRRMRNAIDHGQSEFAFPLPTAWAVRALAQLPAGVVSRLVSRLGTSRRTAPVG